MLSKLAFGVLVVCSCISNGLTCGVAKQYTFYYLAVSVVNPRHGLPGLSLSGAHQAHPIVGTGRGLIRLGWGLFSPPSG